MKRTSIIIPTLNEAENIDPLLIRVFDVIERYKLDAEVLIADGSSSDGTKARVRAWEGRKPVRFIQSDGNRGLSGDVCHAAEQTGAEVVVVMDADLSHPPEALPEMLAPILDGSRDMVIGSRYVRGGKISGWPGLRRMFSKAATLLAWPLVSVRDPMAGFFAVKRSLLLSFGSLSDGYKIGLEIMARSDDTLRVKEVPITFTDRKLGTSKLGSRFMLAYLKQIIRLAGGVRAEGTAGKLGSAVLACVTVDVAVFNLLVALGYGATVSQSVSFAAAAVAGFFLIVRRIRTSPEQAEPRGGLAVPLRYTVICILALFLRMAMIQDLMLWPGFNPRLAQLGGVAAAGLVLFIGIMFFLFPNQDGGGETGIRWRMLAVAAAGYSLVLRILYSGIIDLIPEEAYYWNYGRHLDLGYLDHPPMVGWLNYFTTGFLGKSELVVRVPAILAWCITIYFLYRLTRNLFDKTAALIAVLMISVLPIYIATGMFMMPDPPLYAAWMGALYFLSRALLDDHDGAWLGVGACLGLGMLSKYTIALLPLAALVFVLLHIMGRTRRTLLRPGVYLGAILSVILFLPVIVWNAEHNWVSFTFQGARRWSGRSHFSLHILLINILIVITPLGVAAVSKTLFPREGRLRSVLREIDPEGVKLSFARVFTLVPLAVFVLHSLQGLSKFNWTGPVWLASLPLLGGILSGRLKQVAGEQKTPKSLSMGSWRVNSAGCLLLFGGLLFYVAAGMPGTPPARGMPFPVGWEEMASQIDSIPMEENQNGTPLVVGMEDYWIASEYSFYRGEEGAKEPAGRHLFDKNSLMWAYWLDKKEAEGRDIIVVSFKRSGLKRERLGNYFEKLGETVAMPIVKNGRTVGQVYYLKGYSYKPAI